MSPMPKQAKAIPLNKARRNDPLDPPRFVRLVPIRGNFYLRFFNPLSGKSNARNTGIGIDEPEGRSRALDLAAELESQLKDGTYKPPHSVRCAPRLRRPSRNWEGEAVGSLKVISFVRIDRYGSPSWSCDCLACGRRLYRSSLGLERLESDGAPSASCKHLARSGRQTRIAVECALCKKVIKVMPRTITEYGGIEFCGACVKKSNVLVACKRAIGNLRRSGHVTYNQLQAAFSEHQEPNPIDTQVDMAKRA